MLRDHERKKERKKERKRNSIQTAHELIKRSIITKLSQHRKNNYKI